MSRRVLSANNLGSLGQGQYTDHVIPGLTFTVGKRRRTWSIRYRSDGKQRQPVIGYFVKGSPHSLGLAAAREKAREILLQLENRTAQIQKAIHPKNMPSHSEARLPPVDVDIEILAELDGGKLDGKSGFIYCVEACGLDQVKIGITRGNPMGRLISLQTGSPVNLKLIAVIPLSDPLFFERVMHAALRDRRKNGEWFADDDGRIRGFFIAKSAEAHLRLLKRCGF